MKKRILSLVLVLSVIASLIVVMPVSAYWGTYNNGTLYYEINNGSVSITDCSDYAKGTVIIPDTLSGRPVTRIGNDAFYGCKNITSIIIPESVTSIGSAFSGCSSLTKITIPNTVTSISSTTFSGCSSLTSIILPSTLTYIGNSAFYNCSKLKNITIPESVEAIYYDTFYNCSSLTSITIPKGTTSIESRTFYNCSSLTDIIIPDNVKKIGNYAFYGCSNLANINIPSNVTSIGDYAFYQCKNLTSLKLPNTITNIGEHAFTSCSDLKNINIPNGIKSIGYATFASCISLNDIKIPDSVTSIDYAAFNFCSSLTNIIIPDSVTSIGDAAFDGCSNLTSITISKNLASIGEFVFSSCNSLLSVTIPNKVISIGKAAFANCTNLKSITIPNSVKSLDDYIFQNCSSLTSVDIPSSVTSISSLSFDYCSGLASITVDNSNQYYSSQEGVLFDKNKTKLITYPGGKKGVYTIPNSVTNIGDTAFRDCDFLTGINISESVRSIGRYAFAYCDRLTSIIIPDSVISIGDSAFNGCSKLKSVTLPENIGSIGESFFTNCTSLTNIILPSQIRTIGNYAFRSCENLTSITIPKSVTSIGYYAFENCGSLKNIYYKGTEDEFGKINIDYHNECLTNAKKYYGIFPSILLSDDTITLSVGETKQLNVSYYSGENDKRVTWSSLYPDVASVDQNGKVVGKKLGTTTITAKSSSGRTAVCVVGVIPKSSTINYTDFEYDFPNAAESFGYDWHIDKNGNQICDYWIPYERYLQAGLPESKALLNVNYQGLWGGNCFGMSTSSILFYKNVLEEEHYKKTAHCPKDFSSPNTWDNGWKSKLRNMIELFQVSQNTLAGNERNFFDCEKVIVQLNLGNPVCLDMYEDGYMHGHSVVIYNYSKKDNGYVFDIYDCSGFVDKFIYIDSNNYYLNYINHKYNWVIFKYVTFGTMYKTYENINNQNVNNAISLFSLDNAFSTYTYILIPSKDITISNLQGQKFKVFDGDFLSNIDDISLIPSSYLSETPSHTIIAPTDTYTITGTTDEQTTISLADDYMSVEITAKGTTPITVSDDLNEITLDCVENDSYSVKYTTYDNTFDEMTVSGIANGEVVVSLDGDKVKVEGAKTVNTAATVSGIESVAEAEVNGNVATVQCTESENGTQLQILSDNVALTQPVLLAVRQQTPIPEYDLESGEYTSGQTLTFVDDDETVIYYTTDGSTPTTETGIIYSLPIEINKSMAIKAIATKYGFDDSEMLTLEYTLPTVATPIASTESGSYDNVLYVDLIADEESEIHYTTDGSEPDEYSDLFGASIVIDEDTTIKAIAIKNGVISDVATYEYEIDSKYPFYLINTPTNQNGEPLSVENIADTTSINLVIKKLTDSEQSGKFIVAFYDENDRLISLSSKEELITEEVQTINIETSGLSDNISKMKVFMWDDWGTLIPLSNSEAFNL